MPNGVVQYSQNDGVATITLDRPESLNSMNDELMQDINGALTVVQEDETVRVAVITGSGRGFCSGADLNNAADQSEDSDPEDPTESMGDFFNPALAALHNCPVPTVARVNGVAAGASKVCFASVVQLFPERTVRGPRPLAGLPDDEGRGAARRARRAAA